MFRKSIALALALVLSVACSDDGASSNNPTGDVGTTSPSTTGTPGPTTAGVGTTGVTSSTNAGPTTGTTSPSTTTGTSSTTGVGGATAGSVTSSDTGTGTTTTGVGGGTTGGDTTGTTTGGTTEMEWLPSWATTIQRTETSNLPPSLVNNTLRQFVWPTFSGNQIRVQLSNERGNGPVDIAQVHIAMAGTAAGTIDTSTDAALTFEGNANVTIPQGETVWSDPLDWPLEELKLTALTIQFGSTVPSDITGHPGARTTSYVVNGDAVASESMTGGETRDRWYFIDAIEVMAPADAYAIAVLGDSITDGYGVLNVFSRWPDYLTLKIQEDAMLKDKVSVLNFGMGANSLLTSGADQDSGLVRFDRDVLGRASKIRWVIVLEGVNDIGGKTDLGLVDDITGAYQQIIDKAHEAGILAYGSPITPFKGHPDYAGGSALQIRSGINDWVRTSDAFDAVVDLDMPVADPGDPDSLLQMYSNDELHPNLAGYEVMGNSVELSLFYSTM